MIKFILNLTIWNISNFEIFLIFQQEIIEPAAQFHCIDFVWNLICRIRNKFRLLDTEFFSRHQFTGCLLHSSAIQFWAQICSESAGYFMPPARRRSTQFCFKVDTYNTWHSSFIQISHRIATNFYEVGWQYFHQYFYFYINFIFSNCYNIL